MKALGRYLSDDPELFLTTSKTVSGASVTYYCGAIMLLRYVVPCVMKLLCNGKRSDQHIIDQTSFHYTSSGRRGSNS